MPWIKWFPWRFLVRRAARAEGFLDPFTVLSRLRRFAQPAEVLVPTELLRAGAVFHARGLMNSQAIQHNLDWVWPYWVVRQFDPRDPAFVPRAFSLTHINLTHRNWTAVGLPDCDDYPLVDPRGLVTPLFDGWSLDAWVLPQEADAGALIPSRLPEASQRLVLEPSLEVVTESASGGLALRSRADMIAQDGVASCRMRAAAQADRPAWLVIALRPYNPEGVSFIHKVERLDDAPGWRVNGQQRVLLGEAPERYAASTYHEGDVRWKLPDIKGEPRSVCNVGMATAVALFAVQPGVAREAEVQVPLPDRSSKRREPRVGAVSWTESLRQTCAIRVPDARLQFLYDAALRTLVLHSPADVYPGPYTYRRFWFRDAAFIIEALLCVGLHDRAERALAQFPPRQTPFGYFLSQDGEWDSNGEALWVIQRFVELTGRPLSPALAQAVTRGANWIARKRLPEDSGLPHAGLLPAGFSAEHLGPNDFYFWDDFWAAAGLQAAAALREGSDDGRHAGKWRDEARRLMACVARSLDFTAKRLGTRAMPASPHRRMDAGAIGSLAVSYPLRLWPGDDPRILETIEFLLAASFLDGNFFQEINHSGLNAYLTLHVAQALLRAGDARAFTLLRSVAAIASPTGQWPEAVHPQTRGGCMGDGQHVWAVAEWALMMRNLFVREETDRLILVSGIPDEWQRQSSPMTCGPTSTRFGQVSVTVEPGQGRCHVSWQVRWRGAVPAVEIRLPGYAPVMASAGQMSIELCERAAP